MHTQDVIQLERFLTEGRYLKMLTARKKAPSHHYVPLMEMLLETIRREVFTCAGKAYETLSVEGARKLLMYEKTADLLSFVEAEKKKRTEKDEASAAARWALRGDTFHFQDAEQREDTLPFNEIIQNQLHYSHELQRIA